MTRHIFFRYVKYRFSFGALLYKLLESQCAVLLFSARKLHEHDDLLLSSPANPSLARDCRNDSMNIKHEQSKAI